MQMAIDVPDITDAPFIQYGKDKPYQMYFTSETNRPGEKYTKSAIDGTDGRNGTDEANETNSADEKAITCSNDLTNIKGETNGTARKGEADVIDTTNKAAIAERPH